MVENSSCLVNLLWGVSAVSASYCWSTINLHVSVTCNETLISNVPEGAWGLAVVSGLGWASLLEAACLTTLWISLWAQAAGTWETLFFIAMAKTQEEGKSHCWAHCKPLLIYLSYLLLFHWLQQVTWLSPVTGIRKHSVPTVSLWQECGHREEWRIRADS